MQIFNTSGKLLCASIGLDDNTRERINLSPTEEILQASLLTFHKGKEVSPHIHKPTVRTTVGTQEAWIVIKGKVEVAVLDFDASMIKSFIMYPGDCAIFFAGGHSFETLSEEVIMYEIKNGPYYGPDTEFLK